VSLDEQRDVRTDWRLRWLASLAELSDVELQLRWVDRRITNPHWSFVEFVSCYFTDVPDSGYEALIRRGVVSDAEYRCVRDFHEHLAAYQAPKGDFDAETILRDPRWQQIVSLGKLSVLALAPILGDQDERDTLLGEPRPLEPGDFTWPHS
jgi:hypothetical protein